MQIGTCTEAYRVKLCRDLRRLYSALEHVTGLFLRADEQPWLVVLPAEEFLRLLARGDMLATLSAMAQSTASGAAMPTPPEPPLDEGKVEQFIRLGGVVPSGETRG
jgi:hypothetical protein